MKQSKPITRLTLSILTGFVLIFTWVASSRANGRAQTDVFLPLVVYDWPFTPPEGDHLLITEVMYDPDESGGEWIELYNSTSATIALADYKVGDEETLGEMEGMLKFPTGATIAPQQIIIVAEDANVFLAAYGFNPDYEMTDSGSPVPDMEKYTAWTG
ncbi:MAG: lamin tail domain-containing protein, partial [Chloroflexi bacterium]|nr:lamin tail domain-containing protein [Chloroflexota bacterium]